MMWTENAGLRPLCERSTIEDKEGRRPEASAPKTVSIKEAERPVQGAAGMTTTSEENQIVADDIAAGELDKPSKPEWMTSAEAALALGLTADSLRSYRVPSKRRGPPFVKFGHGVMYRRSDVEAYLASRGEG